MPNSNPDTRKLAAIIITDMVGCISLMQKREADALELLDEHQKTLRPVFPMFQGIEVSAIGNAFLIGFETASDATLAAITCSHPSSL